MFTGRLFGLCAAVGALAACVSMQPVELTCQRLGLPTATGEEVVLSDFAVRAPASGAWCQGPRARGVVTFVTLPLMGQTLTAPPSEAAMHDSVVMMAQVIHLDRQEIRTQQELSAFAKGFLAEGYASRMSEDGVHVSQFIVAPKDPRFSSESVELMSDPAHPDVCVRFLSVSRERDNPIAPGIVLQQHVYGAICRLPGRADRLAYLALSERHTLGQPVDPSLFARLRAGDGEAFLSGFRPVD